MWGRRDPRANTQAALSACAWHDLMMPALVTEGTLDPASTHCRFFPSPYDVPMAVRAVQTAWAWRMAWRYLQDQEVTRRQPVGWRMWAHVGRHSGRLLVLEGEGWPPLDHATAAFSQWHAQGPAQAGVHREVMAAVWPQAVEVLVRARPPAPMA